MNEKKIKIETVLGTASLLLGLLSTYLGSVRADRVLNQRVTEEVQKQIGNVNGGGTNG